MKDDDSNRIRKTVPLLLIFAGCVAAIIGFLCYPELLSKYVIKREVISRGFITKATFLQLLFLTLGLVLVMIGGFFLKRGRAKIIVVLGCIGYLWGVYHVYISRAYPNNIFADSRRIPKLGRAILGTEIFLSDFEPIANLVTKNQQIMRAKYPVIDFHFHLKSMTNMKADELILSMEKCGIAKIVNLDGSPGDFEKYSAEFKNKYPDRFIMFTMPELYKINEPTFATEQVALLTKAVAMGAEGIKVGKDFGLRIRDSKSKRFVSVADPRCDPIWAKAGELGIPVLIHTADPAAFFQATNGFNERFEELNLFPDWSFCGGEFPRKEVLLQEMENLLKKHPKTIFVGAHMGNSPEDLGYLGYLLDKYANFYVDISSRLNELGRQPFTARKFFIKYQDRILFGTDGGYYLGTKEWPADKYYRIHFEFLETNNEYFPYPLWDVQKQGRWQIYGLYLPDEVLEKIYNRNAQRLLTKRKK